MSALKKHSNTKLKRTVGKKQSKSKGNGVGSANRGVEDPMNKIYTLSLTELQRRAKKYGIPFGGLHKSEIVDKIRKYVKKSM